LKTFVAKLFAVCSRNKNGEYETRNESCRKHIETLWKELGKTQEIHRNLKESMDLMVVSLSVARKNSGKTIRKSQANSDIVKFDGRQNPRSQKRVAVFQRNFKKRGRKSKVELLPSGIDEHVQHFWFGFESIFSGGVMLFVAQHCRCWGKSSPYWRYNMVCCSGGSYLGGFAVCCQIPALVVHLLSVK
jgi:hypothetical protein